MNNIEDFELDIKKINLNEDIQVYTDDSDGGSTTGPSCIRTLITCTSMHPTCRYD